MLHRPGLKFYQTDFNEPQKLIFLLGNQIRKYGDNKIVTQTETKKYFVFIPTLYLILLLSDCFVEQIQHIINLSHMFNLNKIVLI